MAPASWTQRVLMSSVCVHGTVLGTLVQHEHGGSPAGAQVVHKTHAGSVFGKGSLEDTGPCKMNRIWTHAERRRTFCGGEGLCMSS